MSFRIDRNSLAGDRLRRNFQRLTLGTATADIQLAPSTGGNIITSTSAGYEVVIPATNNLYVDVNGNDSTGMPNYVGRPYQNISTALLAAASLAPATVYLGSGTWNLGSTSFIGTSSGGGNPNGVNIIGSGNCRGDKSRGGTIIISDRLYAQGRVCVPGNDVIYAHFYVEDLAGSNSTGGTLTAADVIGFFTPAGDLVSNNVLLIDVGAYGQRAGLALALSTSTGSTSTTSNYQCDDCWFLGHLDGINTYNFTSTSSWLNLSTYNCIIAGVDPGDGTTSANNFVGGVQFTTSGNWSDFNSQISALEMSTSGNKMTVAVFAHANANFSLHGTYLTSVNSSGSTVYDAYASTTALITLDTACNYNPLLVNFSSGYAFGPWQYEGDLATVNSSGQIVPISVPSTQGYVLTVDSTSNTGLTWQSTGSSTGVFPVVSTDPTLLSTNIGQAWFNSTQYNVKWLTIEDSTGNKLTEIPGGTFLASAQNNSVTASTTAQIFPNTSYTFPIGFMNQANRILNFWGSMSANAASVGNTWEFFMNIGSTKIDMIVLPTLTTGQSATFIVQGLIGVQTTGSSGEIYVSLAINGAYGVGPTDFTNFSASGYTPFNLTSTITFSISAAASTTNAGDSAAVRVFDLQVLQ